MQKLKSRSRQSIEGKRIIEKLSSDACNVNRNIFFIHNPLMLLFISKKIRMYVFIVMERRYDSSILYIFLQKQSMKYISFKLNIDIRYKIGNIFRSYVSIKMYQLQTVFQNFWKLLFILMRNLFTKFNQPIASLSNRENNNHIINTF